MFKTKYDKIKRFTLPLRRFRHNDDGVAAIEMAFILPIMALLFFGLINLTNGLTASRKINMAAGTMADLVTQENGTTTKAQLDALFNATYQIVRPLNPDGVRIELYQFTHDNPTSSNIRAGWNYSNTPTASNAPISCGAAPAVNKTIRGLMTGNNDLIIARVCSNYHWLASYKQNDSYKFNTATSFKLSEELSFRPRHIILDCSDC